MTDAPATATLHCQGLTFRDDPRLLSAREREEISEGPAPGSLSHAALGTARPGDRILVFGSGAGLVPALLAGRLGVRRLGIVEPSEARRGYLADLAHRNQLVRLSVHEGIPDAPAASMIVADIERLGRLPANAPWSGLRAATLQVSEDFTLVSAVFTTMSDAGLTYFPKRSSGTVLTFLRKWH
ncbi:hypothetical protein CLV78_102383 [Aliiruegeria haliotis]|uniref:Uncharacterized protein n=1 Tax=Aliiruegeria haliotis TaxID=1280846 RepID=A0A2T0RVI1_9RHOB|nr:hypothetical protein [Aliiruegeria haliotis]PRY25206.1 hypothetical protein CLV78_102383 [Aliiruegeria haliotis]